MAEYSKLLGLENVATWNFATGCTEVSAGCQNCWAELLCKRNQGRRSVAYTHCTVPRSNPQNPPINPAIFSFSRYDY